MDRSLRAKVQLDSSKSFRYKYQLVTGTDARDDSVYRASIATRGKIIYSGLRHGHFLSVRGLGRKSIWLMASSILTACDGGGAEKSLHCFNYLRCGSRPTTVVRVPAAIKTATITVVVDRCLRLVYDSLRATSHSQGRTHGPTLSTVSIGCCRFWEPTCK